MKKILVAVVFALASIMVIAAGRVDADDDSWLLLSESTSGSKVYARAGSLQVIKQDSSLWVVLAEFKIVDGASSDISGMMAGTDVRNCVNGEGVLIVDADGSKDPTKKYYWTKESSTVVDSIGMTLCKGAEEFAKKNKKPPTPKKNKLMV